MNIKDRITENLNYLQGFGTGVFYGKYISRGKTTEAKIQIDNEKDNIGQT